MHRVIHFLTRTEILFLIVAILIGGASVLVSFTYAASTGNNLLISGDGFYQQWTPSTSSSTHYLVVDETKCNGAEDYLYTTVIGNRDSYTVNLNLVPEGYKITTIEITPCASLHTKGYGSVKLGVFYRFNGVDSGDKGNYSLSGTTPRNLATTKFTGLSLIKNADSKLEVGAVLNGFGTTGIRLSRIATRLTFVAPPPPTLDVRIDTNYPRLLNDRYVLAGTQKYLAGRVELKANGGDVKLKDLMVNVISKNSRADIENTFDTINIYEDPGMTKLLASRAVSSGIIPLQNINYTIPKNTTQYLYLGFNVNSIGTGENATAISNVTMSLGLKDAQTTGKIVSTNADIPKQNIKVVEKTYTKTMTVLAAQVVDVAHNFPAGDLREGEQTFFSFGVTAHSGSNTDHSGASLPVYLTKLKLQLATDVASVSTIQLCRVSSGHCIELKEVTPISGNNDITLLQNGNRGYVDMSEFTDLSDRQVKSGEVARYEVKGSFSGVEGKYAQGSLQDLNNSGLVWGYDLDSNGSVDFTFSDLKRIEPRPSGYPDVTGGKLE